MESNRNILKFAVTMVSLISAIILLCAFLKSWGNAGAHKLPAIYFATEGAGVGMISLDTSATTEERVISSAEGLNGITFDPMRKRLYYSSASVIMQASVDGTGVSTAVFNGSQFGEISALAADWITGNLYGVSYAGFVFVCDTTRAQACTVLRRDQGSLHGIAVHPAKGTMYWTGFARPIKRAEMDGSNDVGVLYHHILKPVGIAIDYESSKFYWVEYVRHAVMSCNLSCDPLDVETNVQLPDGSQPWGLALYGDKIYWTTSNPRSVQSCDRSGGNVQTLFTSNKPLKHLALANTSSIATMRKNHCEGQVCANTCVLTSNSFRCLP